MAFHELAGNTNAKTILLRALAQDRLHHALLLCGPEALGKRLFARSIAQALNCPVQPRIGCGECPTCRRIAAGEHPDIRLIVPDGAFIKVSQVRQEVGELNYEPSEGRHRVAILDPADRLNINAANALLKTLEEPPPHSSLILITANPNALLETIRSRCQPIRFAPLALDEMEAFIQTNFKRPPEENRLLARICRGCPGKAAGADLTHFRETRKEVLGLIELLGRKTQPARLVKAAGHFGKKDFSRQDFEDRLDLIAAVLHDLLCVLTGGGDELLTNIDVAGKVRELSAMFTPDRLFAILEGFERVRRDLDRNINRTLALEALFVNLTAT